MAKFKVYVSDYDYPNLDIERSVLEPIGAQVIGLQCKTGEGLAEQAADALDGVRAGDMCRVADGDEDRRLGE